MIWSRIGSGLCREFVVSSRRLCSDLDAGHHWVDRGAVLDAVNALRFRFDRASRAAFRALTAPPRSASTWLLRDGRLFDRREEGNRLWISRRFGSPLLRAQCDDRINVHCASRGNIARNKSYRSERSDRSEERYGICRCDAIQNCP